MFLGHYDNIHDANTEVARIWQSVHEGTYQVHTKDKWDDGRIYWAVLHQDVNILQIVYVSTAEILLPPSALGEPVRSGPGVESEVVRTWGDEINRDFVYIDSKARIIDMKRRVGDLKSCVGDLKGLF